MSFNTDNKDQMNLNRKWTYDIQLTDFTVSYSSMNQPADKIETLFLKHGQITTLLGPNGCGKSTLLRGILGILPTEGSALLSPDFKTAAGNKSKEDKSKENEKSRNIPALSHHVRAGYISYLPQKYEIPEMTVRTLVSHGRYSHHTAGSRLNEEDRQMIQNAMKLTDVFSLQDRYLRSLSGGELERSYLAMVIAQDTPWIFLDEPTAHTDSAHRIHLDEILARLRDEGRGILLTSHNIPESFTLSDRLVLMQNGSVACSGTPAEIAAEPDRMRSILGTAVIPVPSELRGQSIDQWILIH